MANSVDPDETLHSAASHLGLHCLLRPVCPNTYGKYGNATCVSPTGFCLKTKNNKNEKVFVNICMAENVSICLLEKPWSPGVL